MPGRLGFLLINWLINQLSLLTSLEGLGNHGDDRDEDGGEDVEDGPDHVHLDGSLPLGVLPAEPRDAEDGKAWQYFNSIKYFDQK